MFTLDGPGGRVQLQTHRGAPVQDAFPGLVTAVAQLLVGLVLDGEVLAWDGEAGALSSEGLQRRAAARARNASAARLPTIHAAFDILMADGIELLTLPYEECRRRLEVLFVSRALTPPWTLCPMTTDAATAGEWLESWTDVLGLEGVVAKPMGAPYQRSRRSWIKIKRRDTGEAIVGAITGTLTHPPAPRPRPPRRHRPACAPSAAALRPERARQVAEHLGRFSRII
ncbi:hypothetical protein ABT331_34435 [Streptomyces sp. NPDC000659]|uniref:ATP-dependent DNA ligase n=1 Tax=unclassified Streptomyces TaxID=2593676 RepID=UPI003324D449